MDESGIRALVHSDETPLRKLLATTITQEDKLFKTTLENNSNFLKAGDKPLWQPPVGDLFSEIRKALPAEEGKTPLFKEKFTSISQALPKLADIFQNFPENTIDDDGAKILVKNPEEGTISKRIIHLIASVDDNNGKRNEYDLLSKVT